MHDDDIEPTDALTPAQRELEAALRTLAPAAPAIDRDRLMFDAGVASARRSIYRWRGAAGVVGAIAAMLVVALGVSIIVHQRDPRIRRQFVDVDRPPIVRPTSAPAADVVVVATDLGPTSITNDAFLWSPRSNESNYLLVRDRALRWGVSAALPAGHVVARPAKSPDVNQLLGMPAEQPQSPTRPPLRSLKDLLPFGDSL